MASLPSMITALRLSAGSTRFSVCPDMGLDDAGSGPAVAPLHRFDQRDMLGDELRRIMAFDIGDADPHQAIGLSDQVAQRLPPCGGCRRHPPAPNGRRGYRQ